MDQPKATQIVSNVLSLMGLSDDQFQVSFIEDGGIKVQINLPEEETGIFIGHHGDGLASLQLVLSLILSQRLGQWQRISLNINDYQERREDSLKHLADTAVEKALSLKQDVVLGNLSSYERRIIHLHLENHPDVTTQSQGEEPLRQLLIVPKNLPQ